MTTIKNSLDNQIELNKIYNEDCLEGMKRIADDSIDLILCDLPYGTTNCKWDNIIPFDELWEQYKRILKPNGVVALFSAQPFTNKCISSNLKWYKYSWYWVKNTCTGFQFAKYQPMRKVEEINIFYNNNRKSPITYNPQGLIELKNPIIHHENMIAKNGYQTIKDSSLCKGGYKQTHTGYPNNVLRFNKETNCIHATQKPVALLKYLIKTYSHEGETVLDNCLGSGSTAIAAINTKRNFIGFELDKYYFNVAQNRINKHLNM